MTKNLTPTMFVLLSLSACVLPGDDAEQTSTSTPTTADTGASTGAASSAADGSTGADVTAGTGTPGSSSGVDGSGSDGGDPPPTDCSSATLLLGNPYFDGDLEGWNPAGQGMLDDPPLRSRHLAALPGGRVAIETQSEVWGAADGQIHRIAGNEDTNEYTQYRPSGACEDVLLLIGAGVTGLPDGRIVVADNRGNGLVELRDPFGTCTAAPIAGNPDTTLDVDVPNTGIAAEGDVDGPGAMARFAGVERPTSDADGNIYVFDTGNRAIKVVADDADRTVTTVYHWDGELPMAMTAMNGLVYVSGSVVSDDFIWAIDPATGTREVLHQGSDLFPELDSTAAGTFYALANDGVDLLLGSGQGYIFRVSSTGAPIGVVAGYGVVTDFPEDLDLSMPIPTLELPIHSYATALADLVRAGDDFLFTNVANGVGYHVWSIHCG